MKKFMLILAVLSVVLMGCPNPVSEPEVESPFEGTWVQLGYPNTLYFTGSNFRYTQRISGVDFSGIFSYTETTITFNPTEPEDMVIEGKDEIPWTSNYEIHLDPLNRTILNIELTYLPNGQSFYMIRGNFLKEE